MDLATLLPVLRDLTLTAAVLFALLGGQKGLYVWRWYYDERLSALTKERDEWRGIALSGLGLAEKLTGR